MLENIRDRPKQKFTPSHIKDIECIKLSKHVSKYALSTLKDSTLLLSELLML